MLNRTVVCAIPIRERRNNAISIFGGSDSESGKRALRGQELENRNDPRVDANRASESIDVKRRTSKLALATKHWTAAARLSVQVAGGGD